MYARFDMFYKVRISCIHIRYMLVKKRHLVISRDGVFALFRYLQEVTPLTGIQLLLGYSDVFGEPAPNLIEEIGK